MNPSKNKFELTIVVPTYNEADIIESSLRLVTEALGEPRSRTEVIIADDGSDDLPDVIARSGTSFGFADIKVMRNPSPLGKGRSIQQAFQASQGDIVGFIDIDLSVAPSYIPLAVREIKHGNDICIGSRVGNRFETDKSFVTSTLATIFAFINKTLLFGRKQYISDTQCGFKFFRHNVALELYQDMVAYDGLADLEILVKAVQGGYTISKLEVPRINDRVGKRKLSRVIAYETISLWRIFCKYRLNGHKAPLAHARATLRQNEVL